MDSFVTAAKLFGDVIDNRFRLVGQHCFEANQRRRCERNSEQFFNRLRDFAITDSNDIPQVDGLTSQMRANTAVEDFAVSRFLNQLAAVFAAGNAAPPKCGQWLTFGQLCSCWG